MDADLDTLCTAVYVTADDLLPSPPGQRPSRVNDAEVVTLAVAQARWASPPTGAFSPWPAAPWPPLSRIFPASPATTSAAADCARRSTGWPASSPRAARATTTTWCCWTPPRSSAGARSRPSAARPLPSAAGYGWSRSHSRFFWGMRLHLVCALDGTPRRAELCRADRREREVALELLPRTLRGGEIVVCDKGYAGRGFRAAVAGAGRAPSCALAAPTSPGTAPSWGASASGSSRSSRPSRTCSRLERHGARTPEGLRARIGVRLLALAASVWLNHQLGRPSRALVDYVA